MIEEFALGDYLRESVDKNETEKLGSIDINLDRLKASGILRLIQSNIEQND